MFVNGGSPWKALTTQFVFNNHQMFSVIQAVVWRIGLVGETSQRLLPVMRGAAAVGLLTWWVGRRTDAFAGCLRRLGPLANPIFVHEFRTLRGYVLGDAGRPGRSDRDRAVVARPSDAVVWL